MPQYLVTGGAGFIGSHLVSRLVADGHPVRVLDDLSTGSLENLEVPGDQTEFLHGDVTDSDRVVQAADGCDVIFHQAAVASVPLSIERPAQIHAACATGTLNVLDAARKAGVRRVVYAGSSSAYGNVPLSPKREDQLPEVVSPYAAAKLAGELYCQAFAESYDLEVVRLRYFNVYGPRQDPAGPYSAVIPLFVTALLENRTPRIFGDGTQSRDFVFVEDVVEANLLAAQAHGASGHVFNIGSGNSVSIAELLKTMCDALDRPFAPEFAPPRPGDIQHSYADISAAQQALGYRPRVSLEEGLSQTLAYYADVVRAQAAVC